MIGESVAYIRSSAGRHPALVDPLLWLDLDLCHEASTRLRSSIGRAAWRSANDGTQHVCDTGLVELARQGTAPAQRAYGSGRTVGAACASAMVVGGFRG